MSKLIETLHSGHRGYRTHLAARSPAARCRELVSTARPSQINSQSSAPPSSPTGTAPRESTRFAPPAALPPLVNLDDYAVAAYERILQQLQRELDLSEPRCVCLTGAEPGDGTTTTAINLAFVAAQKPERRVIVVDANLARPQIAHRLNIQPTLGLGELLMAGFSASEAIDEVPLGGFDVLSTDGPEQYDPALFGGRRMDALLRELKQVYDLIIVDAPHVHDHAAASILGLSFDAVYLVLRMFKTRRESARDALSLARSAGIMVRGCIVTHEGAIPNACERTVEPDAPDDCESVLDNLKKLESICPFDQAEPPVEDSGVEPQFSVDESRLVSALETTVDDILSPPPAVPTVIAATTSMPPIELLEQPVHRRFRVHQPDFPPASQQLEPNGIEPIAEYPATPNETWAANVLAVCGGLLLLAGILYVAVDVVFWF